jgi:hypothetical protein
LEQQLKLPNGRVLVRDVGPITFTVVLDATTGDFISFSAFEKQPHPLFDTGGADGAAYCAAIVPPLS